MNINELAVAKKKSKALTEKQKTVYDLIKERRGMYEDVMPRKQDVGRFVQAAMTAVKMSPKLQQCKADSLLKAIMESARFGLEPNTPLSEASLVPYGSDVEFLIEYRGLLKLAWNSGLVLSIDYDKVCENDHFVYEKGFNFKFEHIPNLKGDRGKPYAYYAYAEMKGGGKALTLMSRDEIERHGARFSKSYKYKTSPWQTDFDAMAIKTAIRQLVDKKLPKSTTAEVMLMSSAAQHDETPEEVRDSKWGYDEMEIPAEYEEDTTPIPEPEPEPPIDEGRQMTIEP